MSDKIKQLEKLGELLTKGEISDKEFQERKSQILGVGVEQSKDKDLRENKKNTVLTLPKTLKKFIKFISHGSMEMLGVIDLLRMKEVENIGTKMAFFVKNLNLRILIKIQVEFYQHFLVTC